MLVLSRFASHRYGRFRRGRFPLGPLSLRTLSIVAAFTAGHRAILGALQGWPPPARLVVNSLPVVSLLVALTVSQTGVGVIDT